MGATAIPMSMSRFRSLRCQAALIAAASLFAASGTVIAQTGMAAALLCTAAGLGVACINAAVLGESVVPWRAPFAMPPLTSVQFGLLPPQAQEPALVQQVRSLLQQHWS